jgi:hypothetical protein
VAQHERSQQAGWALKCIQISVVFTYFLVRVDQDPKRRLEHHQLAGELDPALGDRSSTTRPGPIPACPIRSLLHLMQWLSFTAELTAVVVLWLRGRALLAAAVFWMGFHVFTLAMLYIHFAPNGNLLAGLCAVRAFWSLAAPGQSQSGQRAGRRPPGMRCRFCAITR